MEILVLCKVFWGSLNLVRVLFLMPETKPPQDELTQETAGSFSDIASKFGQMVAFLVPVTCIAICVVVGAIHCTMATMPNVLEDTFGLSPDLASLIIECCSCLGLHFLSVVMTVASFVVELNPLMVLNVDMLVQSFAIVRSFHREKCSFQQHLPE